MSCNPKFWVGFGRANQSQNSALTERASSPGPKGHFPVLISIRRFTNRSVIDGGGTLRCCTWAMVAESDGNRLMLWNCSVILKFVEGHEMADEYLHSEHCHQILHLKNPFIHVKRKQTKLNFPLTLVVFYHADNLALLRDFFFILYFGWRKPQSPVKTRLFCWGNDSRSGFCNWKKPGSNCREC